MRPSLVVLAAGMGSRYGGLKQIDPVGPHGETIIDYSVYDAIRAGFGKLVFVIRRDIESAFKESIGKRFAEYIPVEYVYQELDAIPPSFKVPPGRVKPWGTGHAILMAADVVREPFGVINADDFYGAGSFVVLREYLQKARSDKRGDYCMVGFQLSKTLSDHGSVSRGVCTCDAMGFLQDVIEHTRIEKDASGSGARYLAADGAMHPLSGGEIVSMNMWGFTPSIFDHLRERFDRFLFAWGNQEKSEFFIPTVVNDLIDEGLATVHVLRTDEAWFGATYPEDKAVVTTNIARLVGIGRYPSPLWS